VQTHTTEFGGLLLLSQQRSTCPYPVPHQPIPRPPSYFFKIHFDIGPHLSLELPSALFPSGFPTKTMCAHLPNNIRDTRNGRGKTRALKYQFYRYCFLKAEQRIQQKKQTTKGTKKISGMQWQRKN